MTMHEPGPLERRLTRIPLVAAYLTRVREPILADRSLDLMAAAFWGLLSVWGIASSVTGLPTVGLLTNPIYEIVWGGCIGVLCLLAFYGAISTFFTNPDLLARIRRKGLEMRFAAIAGGFIAVYPALLAGAVIFQGRWDRFALIFGALTFIVVPTWRVRHLYQRIAKLRQIAREESEAVTP